MVETKAIAPAVHRDLARAISAVENGYATVAQAAERLDGAAAAARTKRAYVIGVTGPPGAGKSTVVDRLIEQYRARGETVAVVAIDPSSPFTKGAVLGDRVRMQRHSGDFGVYIRSMASREAGGGLAPSAHHAIRLAERAGFDVIIVETVGVGQVELEIVSVADVIVVVTVPALGDGVQTIKAGVTEIADIFVVNMADRPGANRTAIDLRHMLQDGGRHVPVLKTVATENIGLDELLAALEEARSEEDGGAARAVRFEVLRTIRDDALRVATTVVDSPEAKAIFARLSARDLTRREAADTLLALARSRL